MTFFCGSTPRLYVYRFQGAQAQSKCFNTVVLRNSKTSSTNPISFTQLPHISSLSISYSAPLLHNLSHFSALLTQITHQSLQSPCLALHTPSSPRNRTSAPFPFTLLSSARNTLSAYVNPIAFTARREAHNDVRADVAVAELLRAGGGHQLGKEVRLQVVEGLGGVA